MSQPIQPHPSPSVSPSQILVLSGRYPQTALPSVRNHRTYARRHGHTFIHCNWPTTQKNPYLNKFEFILEYIDHFEWIFWLDDDAFFIDFETSLLTFLPKESEIGAFCRSPDFKSHFTFLSSGQFFLRGGPAGRKFVEAVLATHLAEVRHWWKDEFGMFTNGDQDAITYLLHEDSRFAGSISLWDYHHFNSRIENLRDPETKVFLAHFTGKNSKKIRDNKEASKILGRSRSLVPRDLELDEVFKTDQTTSPIRGLLFRLVQKLARILAA